MELVNTRVLLPASRMKIAPSDVICLAEMFLRLIPEFGGPDNTQRLLGNAQVRCYMTQRRAQ